MRMHMGYEQFQLPLSSLNANNSKKIKIENDHSQNITPQQPNLQHVQGSPMPMCYEQFKPPQNNLNTPNSGRIKIESEYFLIYDVPGDGQCFFHTLSLAITGNLSQSLVYRLICSEIYNNFDVYEDQLKLSHHSNISRHEYLNNMVHGSQWSTSTEISVATRILQSNINMCLQGRDGHNNICFTKEEYINSSLSRNMDLLLHQNHFKLLIKYSTEKMVSSFIRQALQYSSKAMKIHFQN
jgi:hypothetical protein